MGHQTWVSFIFLHGDGRMKLMILAQVWWDLDTRIHLGRIVASFSTHCEFPRNHVQIGRDPLTSR